MAYNNGDWAVVLPQNNNLDKMMSVYESRRREAEAERKQQERDNISMLNTVDNAFDDKDYMTGTQYDPFFRKQLLEKRNKYIDLVRQNKLDPATLRYIIQKDMSDLGTQSTIVKNFRTNLDKALQSYPSSQFYKQSNIRDLAFKKFLFNLDGSMRSVTDLKETPDEILTSVFLDNPGDVVDIGKIISKKQLEYKKLASPISETKGKSAYGTYNKFVYSAKPSYSQELAMENGKLLLDARGNPYLRTRVVRVRNPDGTYREELPQDIYTDWDNSLETSLVLKNELKKYNQELISKGKTPIDENSTEGESIKKQLLYNIVNNYSKGSMSTTNNEGELVFMQRHKMGFDPSSRANSTTNFILRVKNALKSNDDDELDGVLSSLKAGSQKEVTGVNANYQEKGKRYVTITYKTGKTDIDGNEIKETVKLDPNDKDFYRSLARVYQTTTGSDKELEQKFLTGEMDTKLNPKPEPKQKQNAKTKLSFLDWKKQNPSGVWNDYKLYLNQK